jgi:hypothetical protein
VRDTRHRPRGTLTVVPLDDGDPHAIWFAEDDVLEVLAESYAGLHDTARIDKMLRELGVLRYVTRDGDVYEWTWQFRSDIQGPLRPPLLWEFWHDGGSLLVGGFTPLDEVLRAHDEGRAAYQYDFPLTYENGRTSKYPTIYVKAP